MDAPGLWHVQQLSPGTLWKPVWHDVQLASVGVPLLWQRQPAVPSCAHAGNARAGAAADRQRDRRAGAQHEHDDEGNQGPGRRSLHGLHLPTAPQAAKTDDWPTALT